VQPGDQLARIAARYGVTVTAIVKANDLANPNLIRVGQRLIIPLPQPSPVP
jgi:spore germination protein